MFQKILYSIADNVAVRLILTGALLILPLGFTTAWLGAAYQTIFWKIPFQQVLFGLMLFGLPCVFISGFILLYPLERWIIREKAMQSWKWTLLRILLYLLAGIPEGYATRIGIRLSGREYPAIIESIYFVQTITSSLIMGILYTLVERAVAEIRKREAVYKKQIEILRIEINHMKREQQVKEIVETDFFHDLQQKAQNIRKRAEGTASV